MDTPRALLVAEFQKLARIINWNSEEIRAARLVDTRIHVEPCQKLADAAIIKLEHEAVWVDGMLERAMDAAEEDTITVLNLEAQKNAYMNRHLGPLNEVLQQTAALLGFDSVDDVKTVLALDQRTRPTLSTEMLEHLVQLDRVFETMVSSRYTLARLREARDDGADCGLFFALRKFEAADDGISSLPQILRNVSADAVSTTSIARLADSVREEIESVKESERSIPSYYARLREQAESKELGLQARHDAIRAGRILAELPPQLLTEADRRHEAMRFFDYSFSKMTLAMFAVYKEAQRRRTPVMAFFYANMLSGMTMPEGDALRRHIDHTSSDLFKACEEEFFKAGEEDMFGGSAKTSKRRRSRTVPSSASDAVPVAAVARTRGLPAHAQIKAKAKARSKSPKRLRK